MEGWGKPINCSKRAGHGTQTLKVATGNSCNPAFVTMGLKIGTEAYYRYLKSFGSWRHRYRPACGGGRHLCQ